MPDARRMLSERLVLPPEPTNQSTFWNLSGVTMGTISQMADQSRVAAVTLSMGVAGGGSASPGEGSCAQFHTLLTRVDSCEVSERSLAVRRAARRGRGGPTLRARRGYEELDVILLGQPIPYSRLEDNYRAQARTAAREAAQRKRDEERARQPPSRISSWATAVGGFMGFSARSSGSSNGTASFLSAQSVPGTETTATTKPPVAAAAPVQVTAPARQPTAVVAAPAKKEVPKEKGESTAAVAAVAKPKPKPVPPRRRNQPPIPSPGPDDASLGYSTEFDPYQRRRKRIVRTFLMLSEYNEGCEEAEEAPVVVRASPVAQQHARPHPLQQPQAVAVH